MSTNIVTDQSKNVLWNARKGDDQSLRINFLDDGDPYDVSGETFTVLLMRFGGGTILTLTQSAGLTNGGVLGTLDIAFTSAMLQIEADTYLIFLKSTNGSRTLTWLNGAFVLNGDQWDGTVTDEEDIQVIVGNMILNLNITLAGGSGGGGSDFYRGDFTMTTLYPAAGTGSGTAGAIQEGDTYRLVIGGSGEVTIGGKQYFNGQLISAATDTPGQTTVNWNRIIT